MINKGIVLYGAGAQGNIDFLNATNMNLPVKAFVDQKANEKKLYRGISVLLPETAYHELKEWDWIISIAGENEKEIISKNLSDRNIVFYKCLEDYCVGAIDYHVSTEQYGELGYGFPVAVDYLAKNPLIYSFGVGDNWTFEKDIHDKFGGQIYMFDPSPGVVKTMENMQLPNGMFFENAGLSDKDRLKKFHIPNCNIGYDYSELNCPWTKDETVELQTNRLITLMEHKGHSHLNLLKMDVEGSEFAALPDIMESNIKIDQICMETHARVFPNSIEVMHKLKKLLNDNGFLLVCNKLYEQTYIKKDLLNS